MKKYGFTLIELLAVIVILAILALITIPLVLQVIEKAKKGAVLDSAYGLISAIEYEQMKIQLDGESKSLIFHYNSGIESSNVTNRQLNYKGMKPTSGTIQINKDGNVSLSLLYEEYCLVKQYNEPDILISNNEEGNCNFMEGVIPETPQSYNNLSTVGYFGSFLYVEWNPITYWGNGMSIYNYRLEVSYNEGEYQEVVVGFENHYSFHIENDELHTSVMFRVRAENEAEVSSWLYSHLISLESPYSLQQVGNRNLIHITHANNKWVAVGNGTLATSLDGHNWVDSSFALSYTLFANNQWIGVGGAGLIMNSLDGENWNTVASGGHGFNKVIYSSGIWVAVGSSGRISTSVNGTTWSTQTVGTTTLWDVAYANGLFVAVGAGGVIATSTNGTTWSTQQVGVSDHRKVTHLDHKWVTLTYNGSYSTSTNGTTWSINQIPGVTTPLWDIKFYENKWIIVGNGGVVGTSLDFSTWSVQTVGSANHREIGYALGKWIVIGSAGSLFISENGTTWNPKNITNNPILSMACDEQKCILVGYGGTLITLKDLNW